MRSWSLLLLIAILFFYSFCSAVNRVSITSGNWNSAGTWSPAGVPAAGDNITIAATNIVTMNGNPGSCLSLTVNGTANWAQVRTTDIGTGGLTINNGGAINPAVTTTGVLNVAGGLTVPAGASASIARMTIAVTGAAAISGTLNFNDMRGTKTFGDITVASGGTWTSIVAENFTINGNVTNNGTFLSNTGTYTLAGAAKTLGGTRNLIFDVARFNNSYTNTDSLQITTNIVNGGGTITQAANAYFVIGDLTPPAIVNASASGNTVRYLVAANMSTLDITYHHLIIEELGGTANGDGIYTVNGNYSVVGGAATLTDVSIGGNVTVNSGTTLNVGAGSTAVSGITTVNGTLNINSITGTKTFNDLTVNAGGTWNSAVAEAFTINGNLSNSGTFTANTGIYTLAGAGKTISGTISIPNTTVTGSYTNNGTYSATTSLLGAGTFSQGAGNTLNIGASPANFSVTAFNASASGNTVNYNLAGVQNVRLPADGSYHHLTLGGTGTKTLLGATDINGNLTISSALASGNFNLNAGGNWTNNGTYTAGTNTTIFDGAASQTIGGTANTNFNNLTLSTAQTRTISNGLTTTVNGIFTWTAGNFSVGSTAASTLTLAGGITIPPTYILTAVATSAVNVAGNWTNNGTFAYNTSTVTFNGAVAQTIGGTTATNFNNITQSNATTVSLTQNQNLINTLTISSGTFQTTGFNFTLESDASGTARIAAIPAGANFAGNIIMERFTGTGPTDWRFLCSSVSGATIADWNDDIFTSGFTGADCAPSNCATCGSTCTWPSIYTYDETQPGDLNAFGFNPATGTGQSISTGEGFWVYLGPTPVTIDVTGAPNKFSQSPAVTYTNSGDISNDGWNMVANPYPSAIDWDAASWTKTSLDDAVYIYNSYTGSFASYVGGVGVNGGSQFIPSSQAFWVKANAASPGISADENVKAASNPSFLKMIQNPNTRHYPMAFKDFPIPQNTNTTPNSILLTASGNGMEDETFIRFLQGASAGFDTQYDAYKMISLTNISSIINDSVDLSINTLPGLTSDVTVKIRFTVDSPGTYTIRRDSILMLPMSACIFLEDLANGNMTDLRQNISYSFFISDTTSAPRFVLHIYAPITKQVVNTGCSNDSSGIAIAQGTGTGPWNYIWTNSSGDTLQTNYLTTADSLFNLPAGIYYVNVSGSACGTVTDSMEIKSSSTLAVTANYTDVSCYGVNDGSAYATISGGSSPFIYSWSNGATTSAINNLSAGNYSVTVTDDSGCLQTQFVVISQPGMLTAGFVSSTDTVDLAVNNSVSFTNSSSGAMNYLWDFGDGSPNDTAANPIHYYSAVGTYTVVLIASSGNCSDTTYKVIEVINNPVSVNESNDNSSVNVMYDNGIIYLDFNLAEKQDVLIHIYNSLGEKIISRQTKSIQKNRITLSSEKISEGVYLSVIDLSGKILTRRFVISSR